LLAALTGLIALSVRRRHAVEARSLFLRRELALYQERGVKPRRVSAATRVFLVHHLPRCDRRLGFPGIISASAWCYVSDRYWAPCITNIRSRPNWPERIFAEQSPLRELTLPLLSFT